jgi:XXXCH domain-containing protein
MADKIEKKFGRMEFAEYLSDLADQMRQGKIQLKEKKGRIELKINCRWSTLADYTEKDRQQISDWHSTMKAVKKRMGTSFREVTKAAERGVFPERKAVEDFVATSRVFAESADPEWREAMDEYMDHLENFIRAVEEQQLSVMLHEIRDLQYRMKACHKEFK